MAAIVIEPIEKSDDEESAPAEPPVAEESAGTLSDDEALTALREKLVGSEE
jgi:hypothetical protein